MWKALVFKELRETSGIAAAGVVVYLWLATAAMGMQLLPFDLTRQRSIPFLDTTVLVAFALLSAAFTVALAMRQTVGESRGNTMGLLLHLPIARDLTFGIKMLVGCGLYLLLAALPLLLYAWWAATPGTHASPFEWPITYPYWRLWISLPVLYLGAFLSGIRPANWFGTRLLPLAAAGLLVCVLQFIPYWTWLGLLSLALLCVVFAGNSLYAARVRDYS